MAPRSLWNGTIAFGEVPVNGEAVRRHRATARRIAKAYEKSSGQKAG